MDKHLIQIESAKLYNDIDSCIDELIKARVEKDSLAEGKALFRMEPLMVATQQHLSWLLDEVKEVEFDRAEKKDIETGWNAKEWTDEDNDLLSDVIACITIIQVKKRIGELPNFHMKFTPLELQSWCRSLKKRISEKVKEDTIAKYEQKPAEWSEEDKEMLDAMVDIVANSLYEPLCPRDKMLDWLKSLRPQPHWKPSEEQMKHLERCFSHGHTSQLPNQHVLESLYNDI